MKLAPRSSSILGLLAGLVLGVSVAASIFPGRGPSAGSAATSRDSSESVEHGESNPAGLRSSAPSDSERVSDPGVGVSFESALPEGRTPAIEAPFAPSAAPTGSIFGQVLDDSGRAVEGVLLRAEPSTFGAVLSPARVGEAAPPLADPARAGRAAAERLAEQLARTREARTDASGSYLIEGLGGGHYTVTAFREGLLIEPASGASATVAAGSRLDFLARGLLRVRVQVTFADGSVPERAVIACTRKGVENPRPIAFAWSPAEPELSLAPDPYELCAFGELLPVNRCPSGIASALRSEPQQLELRSGRLPPLLHFVLASRAGIHGRISVQPGDALSRYAELHLMPLPPGVELDPLQLAASQPSISVRANDDYAFLDLEPGRYALGLTRALRGHVDAHVVVEVGHSLVRRDIALPPLDRTRYLAVRVLGPEGEALDDLQFQISRAREGRSGSSSAHPLQSAEGVHLLAIPTVFSAEYFSRAPGCTFGLEVRSTTHGSRSVPLEAGQTEVVLRFAAPAELAVALTGLATQEQRARVSLELQRPIAPGERRPMAMGAMGARQTDGTYLFGPVEPGDYVLVLALADRALGSGSSGAYNLHYVAAEPVRIESGAQRATLAVPALHSVEILDGGAPPFTNALIRPAGDPSGTRALVGVRGASFDQNGRARIEEVPAGVYLLRATGGENAPLSREIQVPCPEVVLRPK